MFRGNVTERGEFCLLRTVISTHAGLTLTLVEGKGNFQRQRISWKPRKVEGGPKCVIRLTKHCTLKTGHYLFKTFYKIYIPGIHSDREGATITE